MEEFCPKAKFKQISAVQKNTREDIRGNCENNREKFILMF